jgi:hypothetical protein
MIQNHDLSLAGSDCVHRTERQRFARRLVVTVGLGLVVIYGQQRLQARAASTPESGDCRYLGWSPLKQRYELPPNTWLLGMSLARSHEGDVVSGDLVRYSPGQLIGEARIASPPGRLWAARAGLPDPQEQPTALAKPRVLAAPHGAIHAIWMQSAASDTLTLSQYLRMPARALWHSVFSRDSGWSKPQVIRRENDPYSLIWLEPGRGLAFDSRARLHLTAARNPTGILHLVREADGWRSVVIGERSIRAAYTDVAVHTSGRISVSYVGFSRNRPSPGNDVLVVHSDDDGRTWSDPVVVSSLGYLRASRVRALAGPGHTLHLLWGQSLSPGVVPDVVRHVVSRDGGSTWSAPTDVPLPGDFSDWHVEPDACGYLHLVSSTLRGTRRSRPTVWYSRWRGEWKRPEPLFSEAQITDVALAAENARTTVGLVAIQPSSGHDTAGAFGRRLLRIVVAELTPGLPDGATRE